MRHIAIDTGKCAGHGRCYTVASQFFEPDDEGFAVVIQPHVADDVDGLNDLLAAVDNCPERAISVNQRG